MNKKSLIKPAQAPDPSDLALNWDCYECPDCDGTGIEQISDYPDMPHETIIESSDRYTVKCSSCMGSGYLGMLE